MAVLTEDRFELGIGTGRPVVRQWAEQFGLPWGTADDGSPRSPRRSTGSASWTAPSGTRPC